MARGRQGIEALGDARQRIIWYRRADVCHAQCVAFHLYPECGSRTGKTQRIIEQVEQGQFEGIGFCMKVAAGDTHIQLFFCQ